MSVTPPSSWPWVDHPVSGLRHVTESPCSDSLSLRLPYSVKLATQRKSLTHYTKGTPSPLLNEPSGFISPVRRFGTLRAPTVIPSFYSASLHSRTATRIYFILEGLLALGTRSARRRQRTPKIH